MDEKKDMTPMTVELMTEIFNLNFMEIYRGLKVRDDKKKVADRELTQRKLQKKFNLSDTGIQNLLKGKTLPKANVLYSIAQEFHVTVDELLDKDGFLSRKGRTAAPAATTAPKRKEKAG